MLSSKNTCEQPKLGLDPAPQTQVELGLIATIECVHSGHTLETIDARPMTRKEADEFCRTGIIHASFRTKKPNPEPLFWIPLSAVQCVYLTGTLSDREFLLTPENLKTGFHHDMEDDDE